MLIQRCAFFLWSTGRTWSNDFRSHNHTDKAVLLRLLLSFNKPHRDCSPVAILFIFNLVSYSRCMTAIRLYSMRQLHTIIPNRINSLLKVVNDRWTRAHKYSQRWWKEKFGFNFRLSNCGFKLKQKRWSKLVDWQRLRVERKFRGRKLWRKAD